MNKKQPFETFDCVMITTLLGLEFSPKTIKKVSKKYDIVSDARHGDHYYGFYKLHQACHKNGDRNVQKHLVKHFSNRYPLLTKQVKELDCSDIGKTASFFNEQLVKNPAGLLWALLNSDNELIQHQGVYYVHKLIYDALQVSPKDHSHQSGGCGGNCTCSKAKKNSNKPHTSFDNNSMDVADKIESEPKTLSFLKKEYSTLEADNKRLAEQLAAEKKKNKLLNAELEKRCLELKNWQEIPSQENKLKREIRKLKYDLENSLSPIQDKTKPKEHPDRNRCEADTQLANSISRISDKSNSAPDTQSLCPAESNDCNHQGKVVCKLEKLKVAIIGGLDRNMPRYRDTIIQMGGIPAFHNGKCKAGSSSSLKQMVCRSDIVIYITTINSHNAMHIVKAVCRKSGRELHMIRESSTKAIEKLLQARGLECRKQHKNPLSESLN